MNSLSMERSGPSPAPPPRSLGVVQTVGGALIGTYIGQHFDGTLLPNAIGYATVGALVIICVLVAEKGRLFGVGAQYAGGDS